MTIHLHFMNFPYDELQEMIFEDHEFDEACRISNNAVHIDETCDFVIIRFCNPDGIEKNTFDRLYTY